MWFSQIHSTASLSRSRPLTVLINKSPSQFNQLAAITRLHKSPPPSRLDSADGVRVALCATNDWVFARVSAADGWLLAGGGDEVTSCYEASWSPCWAVAHPQLVEQLVDWESRGPGWLNFLTVGYVENVHCHLIMNRSVGVNIFLTPSLL